MKLKKTIIRKWIKELRSGHYKQTIEELRSIEGDSFCCLGVLCNLHAQMHPEFAATQTDIEKYDGESGLLSIMIREWAGIDERLMHDLASLNDDSYYNFNQIAYFLEEELANEKLCWCSL